MSSQHWHSARYLQKRVSLLRSRRKTVPPRVRIRLAAVTKEVQRSGAESRSIDQSDVHSKRRLKPGLACSLIDVIFHSSVSPTRTHYLRHPHSSLHPQDPSPIRYLTLQPAHGPAGSAGIVVATPRIPISSSSWPTLAISVNVGNWSSREKVIENCSLRDRGC